MEKDITKYLDNEDLEILRNIIFERYTFYVDKVVEISDLMLKAKDEESYSKYADDYDMYCCIKEVLDIFYFYLLKFFIEK